MTRAPDGAAGYVQHDAIRGLVTSVSATAITVQAADGVTMTFVVNGSTKVRVGKAAVVADVHIDDKVLVTGTGTTTLTAVHVVAVNSIAARRDRAGS